MLYDSSFHTSLSLTVPVFPHEVVDGELPKSANDGATAFGTIIPICGEIVRRQAAGM